MVIQVSLRDGCKILSLNMDEVDMVSIEFQPTVVVIFVRACEDIDPVPLLDQFRGRILDVDIHPASVTAAQPAAGATVQAEDGYMKFLTHYEFPVYFSIW